MIMLRAAMPRNMAYICIYTWLELTLAVFQEGRILQTGPSHARLEDPCKKYFYSTIKVFSAYIHFLQSC